MSIIVSSFYVLLMTWCIHVGLRTKNNMHNYSNLHRKSAYVSGPVLEGKEKKIKGRKERKVKKERKGYRRDRGVRKKGEE